MLSSTSRLLILLYTSPAKAAIRSSILRHEVHCRLRQSNRQIQNRFLDIYQLGNKDSIERERARIKDEMSRGYFADMSDLKKHGGKIATANETIIPAMKAVKFPTLEVDFSDGRNMKLPIGLEQNESEANKRALPLASLVCLSFRANSQAMVESWTTPFLDAFSNSTNVHLFEVSLIDSWFLSLSPIKRLLLWTMRKSNTNAKDLALQRHIVYSFGDKYYFRKELKIVNLLTGYMFLLDKFGRIRWQGFGLATKEETPSLVSCTIQLLEEN